MSKSWLSGAGNKLHDVSHNSGTIIQATGSVTINNLGEKVRANPEEECKRALFLTNPVDDKSGVETENKPLIAKSCEWIHQQDAFKTWFVDRGPDSQLLWVSGGLGMGKTMMSLFLIREIERSHMHMQNGAAIVLYYFVDSRNHKRNTAVAILRGLIWRLIEWRPELLPLVVADFMAQREDLFNPSLSSSLEALFRIFTDMLKHDKTGTVHCIIDGLDELQEDNLQPFLRKVTKLFHDERQDMEDFRNGRLHPRAVPKFASLRMVLLSRESPQFRSLSLHHYIEAKVEEVSQARSYGEEIEKRVATSLQDNGDGTFLWVDLAIEELRLYEAQHVDQVVQQLPASVNGIYMRSLARIPEQSAPLVSTLFRWVLSAHRPLDLNELATALLQMGFMSPNPVDMVRQGIAACSTMLAINEETGEVHTTHTSVADFLAEKSGALVSDVSLQRFHVDVEAFDGEIAYISLRYLEQGCLSAGSVSPADGDKYLQRVAQFPLLPYAALFWPEHLRTATRPYIDLSSPFFGKKSVVRKNWWIRINTRDSFGSTPLFWAAATGSMEMFVFLLQRRASQECVGETIFEVACRKGQEDIVKYLLDLGQDLMVRDIGVGGTALHMTCLFGHAAVVKLLISRGSHVQIATDKGWTALHSASWTGKLDCVKLLLDAGSDPQGISHQGWNPLHCAASRGKHAVVSFYLAYGLPVDCMTMKRKTPLHLCAYMGSAATIRVLVEGGAFIDAQSHKGETPLHLAARAGEPEAVEMLLSLGA
ncbi:ankyrin repeat-containing domain protein, partial [Immersiella caudata]